MKEIKAIVRTDRVQAVVKALDQAGVARLLICHVHSLGAGVDPEDFRVSFEEGATYTEKCKVEVVCADDAADDILDVIADAARTGQPGDGIIIVSDVERVTTVRTGDEGALALV
ncbi:MAG: P-II family nitrogen regulator [Longimicrobiales bacterium]